MTNLRQSGSGHFVDVEFEDGFELGITPIAGLIENGNVIDEAILEVSIDMPDVAGAKTFRPIVQDVQESDLLVLTFDARLDGVPDEGDGITSMIEMSADGGSTWTIIAMCQFTRPAPPNGGGANPVNRTWCAHATHTPVLASSLPSWTGTSNDVIGRVRVAAIGNESLKTGIGLTSVTLERWAA